MPDEITYLTDIDSITKENGQYYITLGQGNTGTVKATFMSGNLIGWSLSSTKEEIIHTVG